MLEQILLLQDEVDPAAVRGQGAIARAEQPMDGDTQSPATDVPQCEVDGREGERCSSRLHRCDAAAGRGRTRSTRPHARRRPASIAAT